MPHRTSHRALLYTFVLLLLFGIPLSPAALAAPSYSPSTWAAGKIAIADTVGLLPADFASQAYAAPITRQDFCTLLLSGCCLYGYPLPELPSAHPFRDTTDAVAEQAYALGLTGGTAPGVFSPNQPLTREMAVVMLGRLRLLFQPNQPLMSQQKAAQVLQQYAKDGNQLDAWAKTAMADAYARGIIAGTASNVLSPKTQVTREQAAILTLNTLAYCDATRISTPGSSGCFLPAPSGMYLAPSYPAGEVKLTWGEVPAATAYDVRIYRGDTLVYTRRTQVNSLDLGSQGAEIFSNDGKSTQAALEVTAVNQAGTPSQFSLWREFAVTPPHSPRGSSLSSRSLPRFGSAAEAQPQMRQIEVQVWQLSGGTKRTATITISVYKEVVEDVRQIFAAIYNGPERFPIKSVFGYSFRGTSQHSSGLAIDINPDENYFIGRDGTIKSGKLWQPGVNPYSILPDGDVVRAFRAYGWHWSPDMHWSSGDDYMHFSLSGT